MRTCCFWEDTGKGSAGVTWPPSAPEPPNCATALRAAAKSPPVSSCPGSGSRRGSPSHIPGCLSPASQFSPMGVTKPLLAFTPITLFLEESNVPVNLTKPRFPWLAWAVICPHGHCRAGDREKQLVQPPQHSLRTKFCANNWSTASLPVTLGGCETAWGIPTPLQPLALPLLLL